VSREGIAEAAERKSRPPGGGSVQGQRLQTGKKKRQGSYSPRSRRRNETCFSLERGRGGTKPESFTIRVDAQNRGDFRKYPQRKAIRLLGRKKRVSHLTRPIRRRHGELPRRRKKLFEAKGRNSGLTKGAGIVSGESTSQSPSQRSGAKKKKKALRKLGLEREEAAVASGELKTRREREYAEDFILGVSRERNRAQGKSKGGNGGQGKESRCSKRAIFDGKTLHFAKKKKPNSGGGAKGGTRLRFKGERRFSELG